MFASMAITWLAGSSHSTAPGSGGGVFDARFSTSCLSENRRGPERDGFLLCASGGGSAGSSGVRAPRIVGGRRGGGAIDGGSTLSIGGFAASAAVLEDGSGSPCVGHMRKSSNAAIPPSTSTVSTTMCRTEAPADARGDAATAREPRILGMSVGSFISVVSRWADQFRPRRRRPPTESAEQGASRRSPGRRTESGQRARR